MHPTYFWSNRRAGGNRIRGPHSALTDFLAANNISAQQIRDDYERRRAEAAAAAAQNGEDEALAEVLAAEEEARANEPGPSNPKKRKRGDSSKGLSKKDKKKPKKKKKGGSDDDDSDFDLGRDMYAKKVKLPGQLENCEVCNKRFTVTPYSKEGPEGGLLCTPCGKELAKEAKQEEKTKTKKGPSGRGRRKLESDRLDGRIGLGTKTLVQLCIEKVASCHEEVEELGDLPQNLVERLSGIFSKNRVLNPSTLKLFLAPELETVALYDCAYLETDDYAQIFAVAQNVQRVILNNACQFKDETITYMLEKAPSLKDIQLYGANLVSNEKWIELFNNPGVNLNSLKLQWLDASFDDDAVSAMVSGCPNLTRLKLERCRRIGAASVDSISQLSKLQHLSLQMSAAVEPDRLVNLLGHIGRQLQTLSLEHFADANDWVLEAIHKECRHLKKLRLSGNDQWTDAGFASLFTDWENSPLVQADFSSTRDVDNTNPNGPEEANGLASDGFKALMKHSGARIERLNIASCRHIKHEVFSEVFDTEYPALRQIDISFCGEVDTVTIASIFKSCPALTHLTAFGCFNVSDVAVPSGLVLIGVPKAQDAIEQYGDADLGLNDAMDVMSKMVGVAA